MGVADGWLELGEDVFVRRYAFYDQNIGLILGRSEALVIDTRSTYRQAREIQEHVRELTDAPIGVVVDTHGHFDHAFGNAVFRPATIWGHERCVSFMVRTGERRKLTIAREEPTIADDTTGADHRPDPGAVDEPPGQSGDTGLTRADETPAAPHAPDSTPAATTPAATAPGTIPPTGPPDQADQDGQGGAPESAPSTVPAPRGDRADGHASGT